MIDLAPLLAALDATRDGPECYDLAGVIADAMEEDGRPQATELRQLRMEPAEPRLAELPNSVLMQAGERIRFSVPVVNIHFIKRLTVGYAGPAMHHPCFCKCEPVPINWRAKMPPALTYLRSVVIVEMPEYTVRHGTAPGMIRTDRYYVGQCPECRHIYWSTERWPLREHEDAGWRTWRARVQYLCGVLTPASCVRAMADRANSLQNGMDADSFFAP